MKKLLYFSPTHFTVFLIVGIVLQFQFRLWQFTVLQSLGMFVIFFALLFGLKKLKKQFLFTITSWLLFVFVGMFATFSQDDFNSECHYSNYTSKDSLITFRVDKVLKSNLYYDKYIGTVTKVGSQTTVGKVLLNIQKDSLQSEIGIGKRLLFQSAFVVVQDPLNPYQFNYRKYLERQGMYHQVFLRDATFLTSKDSQKSIYTIADKIRNRIEKALVKNGFEGEELAVIKALILGQRNDISSELQQEYTKAGAIHILAVSGLHVGIILLILTSIFKPLERVKHGKLIKTFVIVVLLWSFAVIAGLSASVVRAVTMFTAVAIGMTFQRKTFVLHSLITSMFVLLLCKPMFLFDVGFQLSYLAVFSIVTIQPKLEKLWKPKWEFAHKFWQLFTVSIAAQLGVLPISLFYFHQFPGLFMLSNLVVIPFIGIILMGGILVISLSLVNMLPSILSRIYNAVISLLNDFVGWVSHQESFLITEIPFSGIQLLLAYACLLLGIHFFEKRSYKSLVGLLLFVIVFQLNLFYEKYQANSNDELLVFNKTRETIIGKNLNGNLKIYHSLDSSAIKQQSFLRDYQIGKGPVYIDYENQLPNFITFKNEQLLIVDSIGVYNVSKIQKPIVLLIQSPKINLERLIETLNPSQIIADASNYKSQVVRWKFVCDTKRIPFYYTGEEGAFRLK